MWPRVLKKNAAVVKFEPSPSQFGTKNRSDDSSTLRQACDEFGRSDLEEPLSWIINLEPRNRNIQSLLTVKSRANYSIAANVMVYEGKVNQARDCFSKALELTNPSSHWFQYIVIVLANLDDVIKIARRFWELNGKGRVSEFGNKSEVVGLEATESYYGLPVDDENAELATVDRLGDR